MNMQGHYETVGYSQFAEDQSLFSQYSPHRSSAHNQTSSGRNTGDRLTKKTNENATNRNEFSVVPISDENASISFDAKTLYDASEKIQEMRSDSYRIFKPKRRYDLLTRPEPDFRPQAFRPCPPKRNSQEAVQPWRYSTDNDRYYNRALKRRKETMFLPKVVVPNPPAQYKFKAGYKPLNADDDRKIHAGLAGCLLPRECYKLSQPHDFREYPCLKSLGLPEFLTEYERDPYNNKLHTRCPRTIIGQSLPVVSRDIELGIFAPTLRQPPKWEARLHHPHDEFPNTPGSYTRFRRIGRDPHEVFMDTVEESLNATWNGHKRINTYKRVVKT